MKVEIKKGATVRLIQPVIEGTVLRADTNGDVFGYQVEYKDEAGEQHERFFPADKLEVIAAAEPEADPESPKE